MHRSCIPRLAWLCFSLLPVQALDAQPVGRAQDQATQPAEAGDLEKGAAVELDGETLYRFRSHLGPFTSEERAEAATRRIRRIADDPFYSEDLFRLEEEGETTKVYYRDDLVGVATSEDVAGNHGTSAALAFQTVQLVKSAIERYRERHRPEELARALISLGVATLLLIVVLWGLRGLHRRQIRRLPTQAPSRFETLLRTRRGMRPETFASYRLQFLKLLRTLETLIVLVVYAQFVFRTLPMTRGYALRVFEYLLDPLHVLWQAFLSHVGNLFFILVVTTMTRYTLKGLRGLARQASSEAIVLPGIAPEWAMPVYKIARLAVIALAVVVIYPYIPGSSSEAFKGVSLFAGALFTLGASGTAANFIGGIVLIFMRTYRLGDRIRIGDTTGDVIEANLLLTRVRTPKHEVVTIPNSALLSGRLVNYSTEARGKGLIVHTSVTIGYDTPWRKVHDLLIRAAQKTSGILATPAPFVLQTSLNDFHIGYEINAFTREANDLDRIYGEMHQHVQDTFQEGGVEILSPAYNALRDGNLSTIPGSESPKGSDARAFTVRVEPTTADGIDS